MSLCGTALAAAVATYTVLAAYAVRTRLKRHPVAPPLHKAAPVTILKPLCGAEHELYECLRSFCDQDHPRFQIVFGVSDPDDPAIGVVARLAREFPAVDIQIAIDRRQHGTSRKVSNLINMMPYARHDLFVISDSDVRVDRDYLARIVVPLADPAVGIVTCPYLGQARKGTLVDARLAVHQRLVHPVGTRRSHVRVAGVRVRCDHRDQAPRPAPNRRVRIDREPAGRRLSAGRIDSRGWGCERCSPMWWSRRASTNPP